MSLVDPSGRPITPSQRVPLVGVYMDVNGSVQIFTNRELIKRMTRADRQKTVDAIQKIAEEDFDCLMRNVNRQ
jgi:hypothetical protein